MGRCMTFDLRTSWIASLGLVTCDQPINIQLRQCCFERSTFRKLVLVSLSREDRLYTLLHSIGQHDRCPPKSSTVRIVTGLIHATHLQIDIPNNVVRLVFPPDIFTPTIPQHVEREDTTTIVGPGSDLTLALATASSQSIDNVRIQNRIQGGSTMLVVGCYR